MLPLLNQEPEFTPIPGCSAVLLLSFCLCLVECFVCFHFLAYCFACPSSKYNLIKIKYLTCYSLLTCRIVRDLMKPYSAPLYWHVASWEIWWNPILLPFTDMSHRERSDETPYCSSLLTCRIVRDLMKPHSAPLYWHVASWEIWWNLITCQTASVITKFELFK